MKKIVFFHMGRREIIHVMHHFLVYFIKKWHFPQDDQWIYCITVVLWDDHETNLHFISSVESPRWCLKNNKKSVSISTIMAWLRPQKIRKSFRGLSKIDTQWPVFSSVYSILIAKHLHSSKKVTQHDFDRLYFCYPGFLFIKLEIPRKLVYLPFDWCPIC